MSFNRFYSCTLLLPITVLVACCLSMCIYCVCVCVCETSQILMEFIFKTEWRDRKQMLAYLIRWQVQWIKTRRGRGVRSSQDFLIGLPGKNKKQWPVTWRSRVDVWEKTLLEGWDARGLWAGGDGCLRTGKGAAVAVWRGPGTGHRQRAQGPGARGSGRSLWRPPFSPPNKTDLPDEWCDLTRFWKNHTGCCVETRVEEAKTEWPACVRVSVCLCVCLCVCSCLVIGQDVSQFQEEVCISPCMQWVF